jgi:hypothetical protein
MATCPVLSKKTEVFNFSQRPELGTGPGLLQLPNELLLQISLWVTTGPKGMDDIHQWGQVSALTHSIFHSEMIQQIIKNNIWEKDSVLVLFWTKMPRFCGFPETIDQYGESYGGIRPVKASLIRWWFENDRTVHQRQQITELYLTKLGLITLPPELGRLTELTYIDLTGNKLKTIPSALGLCPKLTRIILNDNEITEIASGLKEQCPKLWWVELLRNPVSDKGTDVIPLTLKDIVILQ